MKALDIIKPILDQLKDVCVEHKISCVARFSDKDQQVAKVLLCGSEISLMTNLVYILQIFTEGTFAESKELSPAFYPKLAELLDMMITRTQQQIANPAETRQ